MMKKISLLAAPLLVAACASAPSVANVPAPEPGTVTVTAPQPAATRSAPSSDGETLRALLASQGFNYSGPASDLDEVAASICEALDSGVGVRLLADLAMDSGFSSAQAATLIAAAIVVKCPWNESRV